MKTLAEINLIELIETETLESFNRNGYIKCPFHTEKTASLSVKFNSNTNKHYFKCFGCDEGGDAIDFIMKYKNLDYKAAREYLGLEVELTENELEEEKIKSFINWQINNHKKGYKVLGVFPFVDKNNKPLYYKVKFLKPDGKKETPYYSIVEGKVVNKREGAEVPYNYYNILEGIKEGKTIIFVEGEKDVNTINSMFKNKNYVATSIKGVKDLTMFNHCKIFVITDTGSAGEKYKDYIYKELYPTAQIFKVIKLPGLKNLGDNKDVTDWIEDGHTKEDLLNAFKRSLDLKSVYELQQDSNGIYKTVIKEVDGIETYKKIRITDFQILEAARINLVDEDREGVKLKLKSITGKIYERIGQAKVFDDVKVFKNFLGTMDLNFLGKAEALTELCSWVNRFLAIDNELIYSGVKFLQIDEKLHLVTPNGAVTPKGIDIFIKSDNSNKLNIIDVDPISAEELLDVLEYLFEFSGPDKVYTIIGTVINNLMVYQAEELGINLHHLLLVGESGCGKSTTLKNIILPLLNLPTDSIKSIGMTSAFAMEKDLSTGNYTSLFDEYKPSMMDSRKAIKISDVLRNLYERNVNYKGDKSLNSRAYKLCRPIVICGEESYPNSEKANIERSAIVYMAVSDQNAKTKEAIDWLTENEVLLRKLGRSLINKCLNLSSSDYKKIRKDLEPNIPYLKKRPLNTAINAASGIAILNLVIEDLGLKTEIIEGFEDCIAYNIKQEVLEDGEETKNIIEQMLLLFDEMIADGRVRKFDDICKVVQNELYIKTSEMINLIHEHCYKVGSAELIPLKLRDFNKQSSKAGYLLKGCKKQIKIYDSFNNTSRPVWFERFNLKKVRDLGCMNIAPLSEFEERVELMHKVDLSNDELRQLGF